MLADTCAVWKHVLALHGSQVPQHCAECGQPAVNNWLDSGRWQMEQRLVIHDWIPRKGVLAVIEKTKKKHAYFQALVV